MVARQVGLLIKPKFRPGRRASWLSVRDRRTHDCHSARSETPINTGKSLKNRGSVSVAGRVNPSLESDTKRPQVALSDHSSATDSATCDPDLLKVIGVWDRLPAAVRAGIVAMVQAAAK
jgi:hypothetical protein